MSWTRVPSTLCADSLEYRLQSGICLEYRLQSGFCLEYRLQSGFCLEYRLQSGFCLEYRLQSGFCLDDRLQSGFCLEYRLQSERLRTKKEPTKVGTPNKGGTPNATPMPTLDQLLAKPIPELKDRFVDRARPVPSGLVEALESDPRRGAQQL